MNFDLNQNKPVIALLGAGCMGTAIVRRIDTHAQTLDTLHRSALDTRQATPGRSY